MIEFHMIISMENLVRFAALVSVIGFLTGFSSGHQYVQVIEFLMIPVWIHQDYPIIKKFIKERLLK